jgi:hypothetical protein
LEIVVIGPRRCGWSVLNNRVIHHDEGPVHSFSCSNPQVLGYDAAAKWCLHPSLFDEARDLVRAGRANDACPKLEESQRLDPGIGTQLNLADCYEKAGRTASAWVLFLDAGDAARRSGDAKRESLAVGNAKRLEPSLARVRVVVPDVEGIVVKRDGRPLSRGALASALPTDPGKRIFEAVAPGRRGVRVEIDVLPGRQTDVVIPALEKAADGVVAPIPAATSSSVAPPAPKPVAPVETAAEGKGLSGLQIGGIAAGGVGVVALVGGTVLGLAAKSKNDDAKKTGCHPDGTFCTSDALAQHDSAKSQASLATVAFVAGGVLVAGGAALFVFGAPRSKEAASLYLAPTGSGNSGGFIAGGTF